MSRSAAALLLGAALALPAAAGDGRRFEPSTSSKQARELLARLQQNVEKLVLGATNAELARRLVAADPSWAMGVYYQSAVTPPPENQKLLGKAVELAKHASDGERRFVEAMLIARSGRPEQAIEPLRALAADNPGSASSSRCSARCWRAGGASPRRGPRTRRRSPSTPRRPGPTTSWATCTSSRASTRRRAGATPRP